MENGKIMDIASFLGVSFCFGLYAYSCYLRIQQIRADTKCMDARIEKEFQELKRRTKHRVEEQEKIELDTSLKRVLAYVPQVTEDQVNERELVRLTTMQGFRD